MTAPTAHTPAYCAYKILRTAFTWIPVIAGVDKFFDFLVNWSIYLSPIVSSRIDPAIFMRVVGIVEIGAGLLVFKNPRLAGYVIAAWLGAIIINLLTTGQYYDIALRDAGLALGALAMANLAKEHVVVLK